MLTRGGDVRPRSKSRLAQEQKDKDKRETTHKKDQEGKASCLQIMCICSLIHPFTYILFL